MAVLNRNNSDNRLEVTVSEGVAPPPVAALADGHLNPGDCLAVRLSRPFERRTNEASLAECRLCGQLASDIACEPLLVGGTVIGSVLVAKQARITETERSRLRTTVIQATPIIANQRNLSLAEIRAATDALTALPNRREADDTLKRMSAQASRTVTPMAAILLDLDHFKQINDVHGHEQGDEALAAVGSILSSSLRASDFAARYGGEEFLLLLPNTTRDQARTAADKIRTLIEHADVRCGQLTASLGVAALPEDAGNPEDLLRQADRALYAAKERGRNRVEIAEATLGDSRWGRTPPESASLQT